MDGRVSGRCHYCIVGVRESVKKYELCTMSFLMRCEALGFLFEVAKKAE